MDLVESYLRISPFFDSWVRVMEIHSRIMEVRDSKISAHRILILSPPTDRGIKILTQANSGGESYLLCFTERLAGIAKKYSNNHNIDRLTISIANFFSIPFKNGYFDAVFANCFFDFCQEDDFDTIIYEIKRVLKTGGAFYSVYMYFPSNFFDHVWLRIVKGFPYLGQTVHPVDIKTLLLKNGFRVTKEILARRFAFPLKYITAEN